MNWTYILGILGIAIVLYLISSLRVLRQYERGVVLPSRKIRRGARGRTRAHLRSHPADGACILAHCDDANPLAKDHHERQRLDRHRGRRLLSHFRSGKAVIVIENVYNAITQISQTTVRNVVRFSLDQLLYDTASTA
jgi:hypothetical protein